MESLSQIELMSKSNNTHKNLELVVTDSIVGDTLYRGIGYDGEDSIYYWGESSCVGKYSLSSGKVTGVYATSKNMGTGVLVGKENLFHFGSGAGSIFNFKTNNTSDWTVLHNIKNTMEAATSVWDGGEYIYFIGGRDNFTKYITNIWRFSTKTFKMKTVGHLPSARWYTSAVWDNAQRNLYVFGGFNGTYIDEILKFTPSNGKMEVLDVKLPFPLRFSCSVWNGEFAYIIGGWGLQSYPKPNQVIRFHPATQEIQEIPVKDFPSSIIQHQCVFVKKSNRIYIFGGVSEAGRCYNVMHIDC